MIEAYQFLHHFEMVKKVEYFGQILYNVLMENYDKIKVNNLICETLHPNNIIAKLYRSKLNNDYKDKLIVIMNDSIHKKDHETYKKMVSYL